MTESIQHSEKGQLSANSTGISANSTGRDSHKTIVRWSKPLWERVRAAAAAKELDFGAYVRLATINELAREEAERRVA